MPSQGTGSGRITRGPQPGPFRRTECVHVLEAGAEETPPAGADRGVLPAGKDPAEATRRRADGVGAARASLRVAHAVLSTPTACREVDKIADDRGRAVDRRRRVVMPDLLPRCGVVRDQLPVIRSDDDLATPDRRGR